jgi:bifunctional non-homologous end joining protein LigD
MPIEWKKIDEILPTDFTILSAPELIKNSRNAWNGILSDKQDIGKLISQAHEIT